MSKRELTRRSLFGASAFAASAAAAALADPGQAAAQAVGVKKADLPDLTIKEVKVYVANLAMFAASTVQRPVKLSPS